MGFSYTLVLVKFVMVIGNSFVLLFFPSG